MRNAPAAVAQRIYDSSLGRVANAYMLAAVAMFSALPLIISWGDGGNTPFLFNAAMSAGVVLGCLAFMALRYPSLVFNPASLRLIAIQAIDRRIVLSIAANFNFAFLAWSSRFVDVSISAILFGTWPIFIVIIHDRLYQHRDRYHRLSPQILLLLAVGLVGFAFIIVGQAGGFDNVETSGLAEVVIGVCLAVLGAIATACNAFGFHWGTDLADDIPAEMRQGISHESLEFFGLLVAFLIANAVSGLLNSMAGISSGEVMDFRSLFIAVVGTVGVTLAISFGIGGIPAARRWWDRILPDRD